MIASFYTPWDEYARLPAPVIEAHLARCRVLGLPYDTRPADVAASLTAATTGVKDRAAAEVARSVADVVGTVAYMAPGYTPPTEDPFTVLDDPWGLRHIGYWGGRGGSKTTVVAQKLVKLIERSKRPLLITCGREFMASIRESSHAAMKKAVKAVGTPDEWELGEYQLKHQNGSRCVFIGMQTDPGSLDGIDVFWGDEAAFFSQASLDRLIPTVRDAGSLCIWTWNPDETSAPIDDMLRGEEPPELSRVVGVMAHDNAYLYRSALHM